MTVSRFDASGAPKNFTEGPDAGTNTLSGTPGAAQVAVDNSGGALDGDIYVADRDSGTVKVFSAAGASLGTIAGSGNSEGNLNTLCGVAVDQANGDVYVTQQNSSNAYGKVWRYVQATASAPIDDSDFTVAGGISSGRNCQIAVNAGHVYVVDDNLSELHMYSVSVFAPGAPIAYPDRTVIDKHVTAVAVDSKTGEVYGDEGERIQVFDPSGTSLYNFGFAVDFGTNSAGVAVKSAPSGAAGKAYVSDRHVAGGQIDVFGSTVNVPLLTHRTVATFGKDGTSGSSFDGPNLNQLAFDQAAHSLFALDLGVPGIYGFDASAPPVYPPLGGFPPLAVATAGNFPGLAVDNSGLGSAGNLYYVSQGTDLLYGYDSSGAALSGFPVDPATAPGAPNGSPKDLCGTAVDSAGNVWVANSATKRILEYSAAGASLPGSVDTSVQGRPCKVVFDSNDNLYVGIEGTVWRYSAAGGYASATSVDSSESGSEEGVRALAVDPTSDHLYVAHTTRVDEYNSAGGFVDEFATGIAEASFGGVAVDAASGDLYLADAGNGQIRVLGPGVILPEVAISPATGVTNTAAVLHGSVAAQGVALSDCHFEYVSESTFLISGFDSASSVPCDPASGSIPVDFASHAVTGSAVGLASSTTYRFRLLAANATASSISTEAEFTTPGRPIVETVGTPTRTTTTAQLAGRVDPRAAAATYYFEYGSEGPCDANPCTQTAPMSAGSGDLTELVSEEVSGLQPNTTYHYRVLAENGNSDGLAIGGDMTVTTQANEGPLSHGHFPGPPGSDRAWEQVTPPDTGGNPTSEALGFSADGNRAIYSIAGGTPLSDTGNLFSVFFSQRTPTGWQPKSILPPRGSQPGVPHWKLFPDASLSTILAGNRDEVAAGSEIWRLGPEDTPAKVFEGPESAYQLGNLGVSEDGSRLMGFLGDTQDPEHPTPAGMENLYDFTSGKPELVSFMPDGSVPPCGVEAENEGGFPKWKHTISADGSFAFFTSSGNSCSSEQIYVRELEAGQTKRISSSPVSGVDCDSVFLSSSPDAAFFWSRSRLVASDTPSSSCSSGLNGDIYRYELSNGTLDCVTCGVSAGNADVYANFNNGAWRAERSILVAEDGSRVYFQSPRALVLGAPVTGGLGSTYRLNLDTGNIAWIGGPGLSVSRGDPSTGGGTALTPDGTVLSFQSDSAFLNPLNGSDNAGTIQIYRYDDRDRSLVCISCPTDGSAPRGRATGTSGDRIQGITTMDGDGEHLAFSSPTPLISADQNTAPAGEDPLRGSDVYEWRDGRLFLVTDGLTNTTPLTRGPEAVGFSPSGRDLFFTAAAQYTPDALDAYQRLYDARIGGGFEYPKPPPPCPLEVCQGTPKGAPEEQAPGTGSFSGPGNASKPTRAKCAKGKARRKGRCVAKKPKRAHHRANDNRRTTR